jgi:plasmid stabilization system protein ParE
VSWKASPETDEDLIGSRDFIAADNEQSAVDFLDAAFETFDLLAQFPEMGSLAHFRHPGLHGVRYFILPPPFNRWLIFYRSPRMDHAPMHAGRDPGKAPRLE